jgi:chemotaxis protein methyltransferase CheR
MSSISPVDFDYIRKLMRDQTAIVLDTGKEYIAESRLANLISQEGFESVRDLVHELRTNSFNGLHRKVVNAMTNNETWFYRDVLPFQAMHKKILPEMIAARSQEKTLRIWSAACSAGQEPYSLAMMLQENFQELRSWRVQLLATDISSSVLQKAERGRYSQLEINRGLPATLLSRYFTRQGIEWEIAKEIRDKIEFRTVNLSDRWPDIPVMDIIFLRNVLIYFDVEMKKTILGKVLRQLRPDGYMLMGGAETTLNLDDRFQRVQYETTAYYRPRS